MSGSCGTEFIAEIHGVRLVGLVFEVNFHFRWVSGVI